MPNGIVKSRSSVELKLHSKFPGYHSKLPLVFPYFWKGSQEEASNLSVILATESLKALAGWGSGYGLGDGEEGLWFAMTGHPLARQAEVTLWLSSAAAQYLLQSGAISSVNEYEKV